VTAIGQTRYAADVRMGWHVLLEGAWRLVMQARTPLGEGPVLLVLREGMHDERDERLPRMRRLMTRTPQEQIQQVESERLAAMPGRGLGPVSRLHFDQQLFVRVAEILDEEGEES
jgi:hypothetical protein